MVKQTIGKTDSRDRTENSPRQTEGIRCWPSLQSGMEKPECLVNPRALPKRVGQELFHSTRDPCLVVTPEGEIVTVNTALLQSAGKTQAEVIGAGVCAVIHGGRWPHIECPLEEFLKRREYRVEDTRLPGLGGEYSLSVIPVEGTREGQELILLMARKLTQDEVRKVDSIRTAQLAAIGELAAGVAHEINNPINGIINFAQLLLDDMDGNEEQTMLLERIVQEGERIAAITHNLLSFTREDANEQTLVDLNEVVTDCISLIDHQLGRYHISINFEPDSPSCLVVGNHLQLMQVVLNLINNSRYALNERYGEETEVKSISFSCQLEEKDGNRLVQLVIRDNGTGIPQGILDKLFDPFFTSKPVGQGSGLGLSISYGIIKNHGGSFRVNSKLNEFTEMVVELPVAGEG